MTGTLPWSNLQGLRNFERVRDMKKSYSNEKLVRGLPKQFLQFLNYIKTLKYETKPDYDYIHNLFLDLFRQNGGTNDTPYDWESPNNSIQNSSFLKLDNSNEEMNSEDLFKPTESTEEKKPRKSKLYTSSSSNEEKDSLNSEELKSNHKKQKKCVIV